MQLQFHVDLQALCLNTNAIWFSYIYLYNGNTMENPKSE